MKIYVRFEKNELFMLETAAIVAKFVGKGILIVSGMFLTGYAYSVLWH